MFWSQAEWLTRKVLHRPRKERVTKLAFLLGDLRFSPRPGAHKAWGNGKWGAATACGEGSSLFCPERAVLKARPVLQPSDTVSELSWHFRPLHLQALIAIVWHLPWLQRQKGRIQLPSLQTQCATQSPIKQGYLSSCSCLPQRWQRLHPLQPRALFLLLHHTPTACSCCHLPWQSKHLHTWAAQRAPACAAVMLLSHLVRMLKLSWCFCQGSAQPQSNESAMDQLLSKPHHCN